MAIRELLKLNWSAYFDEFFINPALQKAELEVSSLGLGNQIQALWIRIDAVTYDLKDDILKIFLDGLQHSIRQPKSIFVDEADGSLARFEIIDAADIWQVVRLREPLKLTSSIAAPDKVDEAGMDSFPASDPPSWN